MIKCWKKILTLACLLAVTCVTPSFSSVNNSPESSFTTDNVKFPTVKLMYDRIHEKLNSDEFGKVPANDKQLIRDNINALYGDTCTDLAEAKGKRDEILAVLLRHKLFSSPYFYELTHEDGQKLYLLGSCHIAQLAALIPDVRTTAVTCSQAWFEVNGKTDTTHAVGSKNIFELFKEKGMENSPVASWISFLEPKYAACVKNYLDYAKKKGRDFSSLHPAALCFVLGTQTSAHTEDYAKGVDAELMNAFNSSSKPVKALEDNFTRIKDLQLDQQIDKVKDWSLKTGALQLQSLLEKKNSRLMAKKGSCLGFITQIGYSLSVMDLNEIDRNTNQRNPLGLDTRNQRWHGVLDNAIVEGQFRQSNLICVGLAHLPGPTGLLPYFINKGFKAKRMDQKGQFSINSYQDEDGNWVERPEGAKAQLVPPAVGPTLAEIKTSLVGKLTPQQLAAIPAEFNPQVYADLYHNWVAARSPAFQMDELTYATFFYAHFVLPNAKTAAAKLIFMRSPRDAPADFDALRYLQKYAHILAEANDLKIDHIVYAKAHYLHYKDILGVSDK